MKDDRFLMARSKGSAKKDGPPPHKEYMQLRSTSRRPPPPYTQANGPTQTNSHGDCVSPTRKDKIRHEEEDDDPPTMEIRSGCSMLPKFRFISCCITALIMVLACGLVLTFFFPYPLHASCTVKWHVPLRKYYFVFTRE
ncbi:uncharacterized protein LOC143218611 isoform X2 [Lasioglossum baleicum]